MKLFLDDERFPPESWTHDDHCVARTMVSAMAFVTKHKINYISFDHDLGADHQTGYDFAHWLVEKNMNDPGFIPKDFTFVVHSMNPVGRANITMLLTNYLAQRRSV